MATLERKDVSKYMCPIRIIDISYIWELYNYMIIGLGHFYAVSFRGRLVTVPTIYNSCKIEIWDPSYTGIMGL